MISTRHALAALSLFFLAGCSPAALQSFALRPNPETSAGEPGNRLVVLGVDGNVFTVKPDGSERVNLTTDASAQRQYQQPTWSPDASSVAISRRDSADGRVAGALVTIAQDGHAADELLVTYPPFFIYWSPNGEQIAYLSNWQGLEGPSMALRMVDVASNSVDTIAEGSPYYISWAPEGNQLLAHIGSNRLEVQDVSGARKGLMETGADFATPQWAASGDRLLYATSEDGLQQVVIGDPSGKPLSTVTDFEGRISFELSPDGHSLAYVLSPAGGPVNTLGPLFVTDVETQRTRELTSDPVWAYYWSPDGTKLAYVSTEFLDGSPSLRWHVWDGVERTDYAAFLPTRTFLEHYLPFSDQYAQSMRVWSPASDAFTYAGLGDGNQPSIWVQTLGAAAPEEVTRGLFAAWSPH